LAGRSAWAALAAITAGRVWRDPGAVIGGVNALILAWMAAVAADRRGGVSLALVALLIVNLAADAVIMIRSVVSLRR
jgi:hypothetical protein